MTTLTPTALALCQRHYAGGRGCGRCPIQPACHSPTIPLTDDTLDAWRERVNAAAEKAQENTK